MSRLPVRSWGRTGWVRQDYDGRRQTTQVRYGKLHALQDSAPPANELRQGITTTALCGRLLDFTWLHDDPEPPPLAYRTRDYCQRCLALWSDQQR